MICDICHKNVKKPIKMIFSNKLGRYMNIHKKCKLCLSCKKSIGNMKYQLGYHIIGVCTYCSICGYEIIDILYHHQCLCKLYEDYI